MKILFILLFFLLLLFILMKLSIWIDEKTPNKREFEETGEDDMFY